MSFTCTFLSPLMVAFLAVKDSPKLGEPCVTDSCSICSGSSSGTLYFGSPAELPYVSALIRTEILFTNQLTHWHTTFYNTWRTYIYIYIYGAPILDVSRSHTTTQQSR